MPEPEKLNSKKYRVSGFMLYRRELFRRNHAS